MIVTRAVAFPKICSGSGGGRSISAGWAWLEEIGSVTDSAAAAAAFRIVRRCMMAAFVLGALPTPSSRWRFKRDNLSLAVSGIRNVITFVSQGVRT